MRIFTFVGLVGVLSTCLFCQASEDPLTAQLEALHSKWFAAFDAGDWAAMDEMEMPNLVLILPNGEIIQKKTEPRTGKTPSNKGLTHSLENASIRHFGNAAILTGVLITRKDIGATREPTTIVFVKSVGVWKIASAHWSAIPK